RTRRVDPGFDTGRLLVARCDLSSVGAGPPAVRTFASRLLEDMRRLPEIEACSLADTSVLGGWTWSRAVWRSDLGAGSPIDALTVGSSHVGPDYFRTTGIRLLAGRPFHERDASSRVAII